VANFAPESATGWESQPLTDEEGRVDESEARQSVQCGGEQSQVGDVGGGATVGAAAVQLGVTPADVKRHQTFQTDTKTGIKNNISALRPTETDILASRSTSRPKFCPRHRAKSDVSK